MSGRRLQRHCEDCSWKEAPRTPEIQPIENKRFIAANQFSGFHYEIYDRYGHAVIFSRSHETAEKARAELLKDLGKLNRHPNYAPCTGILWPAVVEVVGEVVRANEETI